MDMDKSSIPRPIRNIIKTFFLIIIIIIIIIRF